MPYAKVPGLDTSSWTYKRAVQLLTGMGAITSLTVPFGSSKLQLSDSLYCVVNSIPCPEKGLLCTIQGLATSAVELDHAALKCSTKINLEARYLNVNGQLVTAAQDLEISVRRYDFLVQQQDMLTNMLKG
jgi:hypothetical protein